MPPAASSTSPRFAFAWLVLVFLAVAGAWAWWILGRPVDMPDAPSSRIACVSYAPFRKPGESPLDPTAVISPQRIDSDLRALSKRFDCVRTYSQGQGLSAVPQVASRYGMKVLLGIWLDGDPVANAAQVRKAVAVANKYPGVMRGIVVGNEVLLRGELNSSQLAVYLHQVKAAVSVPVTYADVWEYWLRHPELASAVDFITIHILPYWEDKPVAPAKAVQHVAAVYARVQRAFPGRQLMIGETGWPSEGRPRQTADASLVNEARYLRGFLRYAATVHMPYNVIEAFDQPWKRVQEGTAGGYWGVFDARARPKFPMRGPVTEEPHWWGGWLAGAVGACVFLLLGGWRRRWHKARGWPALGLSGIASGCALAWQARQMWFACTTAWQWMVSAVACLLAAFSALLLARWLAARLAHGAETLPPLPRWLRAGWLCALAYYGLLLVFDGRYRDFPLGLFALPCVGFAMVAWLGERQTASMPMREERFLFLWLPLLALVVLVQEAWLTPVAWLWLLLNLLLAASVGIDGWQVRRRLQSH